MQQILSFCGKYEATAAVSCLTISYALQDGGVHLPKILFSIVLSEAAAPPPPLPHAAAFSSSQVHPCMFLLKLKTGHAQMTQLP